MQSLDIKTSKKFYTRIEFWILLYFVLRLYNIWQPPVDEHGWRQITGFMVARNFMHPDSHLLYPRVDDCGNLNGIIGMEFPLLNYMHYGLSELFGYTHWYGRLLNLIIASLVSHYFYKLVKAFFDERLAFTSTLVLLSSSWFIFSRKMMPDVFCIALMFIAIYQLHTFIKTQRLRYLIAYAILSALAILSKIPAGIYFALLGPFFLLRHITLRQKVQITVSTLPAIGLMYAWYFVWNPYLSTEFGNWYNIGMGLTEGFKALITHWDETLDRFHQSAFRSYIFFSLCLIGLFLALKNKARKLLIVTSSVSGVFFIYMCKSGYFFYHHSYYVLPIVPMMALFTGYALTQIKVTKYYYLILIVGVIEAMLNQQHDFRTKAIHQALNDLESIADQYIPKNNLIGVNGNGDPRLLYFLNRKGLSVDAKTITERQLNYLNNDRGISYFLFDKSQSTISFEGEAIIYEDKRFKLIRLN